VSDQPLLLQCGELGLGIAEERSIISSLSIKRLAANQLAGFPNHRLITEARCTHAECCVVLRALQCLAYGTADAFDTTDISTQILDGVDHMHADQERRQIRVRAGHLMKHIFLTTEAAAVTRSFIAVNPEVV